jgi:hypothetical protein
MHRLNITDILTALRHADPDVLAAAIYADNDPRLLDALAQTLAGAADRTAAHPHPEVVAEGDALLHEVLRWPVADALPPGHALPTATELAAARHMPEVDAERLLHRIAATENVAATRLIESGLRVDFTPDQAQVTQCINDLIALGVTPTRQSIRAHAMNIAAASSPGIPPIIFNDHGLRSRVMSSSPMTVVPGWLDRMDADPPMTGMLDARIDYLRAAVSAMGRSARHHTSALALIDPPPPRTPAHGRTGEHHRSAFGVVDADLGQRMAV